MYDILFIVQDKVVSYLMLYTGGEHYKFLMELKMWAASDGSWRGL
jgi:hypothetical protein